MGEQPVIELIRSGMRPIPLGGQPNPIPELGVERGQSGETFLKHGRFVLVRIGPRLGACLVARRVDPEQLCRFDRVSAILDPRGR